MLFRILDFLIATLGKVVYNKALELSFALWEGINIEIFQRVQKGSGYAFRVAALRIPGQFALRTEPKACRQRRGQRKRFVSRTLPRHKNRLFDSLKYRRIQMFLKIKECMKYEAK